MASFSGPKLSNRIADDVPGIQALLSSLAKLTPDSGNSDYPIGTKRVAETNNGYEFQQYNGTGWVTLEKWNIDAQKVDGYSASTGTTVNTIPVRNANGKLPGDILGNANTANTAVALSATNPVNMGGTGGTTAAQARTNLGVPPTNHASSGTYYGIGNASEYGHNKLSDATSSILGAAGGTAATPLAVKTAKEEAISAAGEALEVFAGTQAAKDAAQDEAIAEALDKVGLPLGFEYTRLTGQNAPLGGVDYMGQTTTRAMYADLWAWLNEHKPDAIVSESEWQSLYSSQNGNVAKYSTGDGSTTFRFPRVVGYFKGADAVSNLGEYTKEGLPNITGSAYVRGFVNDDNHCVQRFGSGALYEAARMDSDVMAAGIDGGTAITMAVDASRSNPIYGNSQHVTPETVTVVMGVIAFGSVASIGESTEEGIVAELGEHGAKLGELEAAIEAFHDNCVGEIFSWPADSEPYRALPINGAAVSRTTYAKLFAKIGTKYGAGDGSTTFNVPNGIGKFLQCDNTAGTVKEAGLPDITGNVAFMNMMLADGCFAAAYIDNQNSAWTGYAQQYAANFNASRSSSIYGNSNTVQPPALTMRYYIKY